jgi:hypothetical protein
MNHLGGIIEDLVIDYKIKGCYESSKENGIPE